MANRQIYPKHAPPSIYEERLSNEMANNRAKRWEARYDEAMDMVELWKNRYVEERKRRIKVETELEKHQYQPKHRAERPFTHPNCMIEGGGQTDGQRNRDPEG